MISIGNTLKEARSKKTLSYDEVHAKIKIHPRVLQLLEEEKFDKLPSPLFAKSFLKSYADFLEVNSDEMLSAYERSGAKNPEQTIYIKPAESQNQAMDFQKIFVRAPLLILAIFMVAGGLYYFSKPAPKVKTMSGVASKQKVVSSPSAVKIMPPSKPKETPPAPKKADDRLRSHEAGNFPVIDKVFRKQYFIIGVVQISQSPVVIEDRFICV